MPVNYPVSERTPGFIPPARTQQGFQLGLGRSTNPPSLTPPNLAAANPAQRELTPEEWAVGKTNVEIGQHITRDLGGLENLSPEESRIWRQLLANAPRAEIGGTPPTAGPREGETNAEWAERLNLPKASAAIKRAVAGMNLPNGKDRYVIEATDEAVQTALDGALMSGDPAAVKVLSQTSLPPNSKAGHGVDDIMDRFARFEATMDSVSNWLLSAPMVYGSGTPREVARRLKQDLKPEGWAALRGATVARLTMLPTESETPTLRDRADVMLRFINGRGEGVVAALFSVDERNVMKRFVNTVRLVSAQDGRMSPDGEQKLQPILRQLSGMIANTAGQPQLVA